MSGFTAELKVGTFAVIVLAILVFMTFKVGGLDWAKKKGYTIHIVFSSTAGLDEKTRVKIAGVDSGVVDGIELYEGKARVRLMIDPSVKLYRNAKASIRSAGLLGDKYLDIRIGTLDAPQLKEGDTIADVTELVDMDDLARNLINVSQNFTKLAESLNGVLGTDEAKRSLSETIVNLRDITANLSQTISVNDQKMRSVLDNINNLTASLSGIVDKNSEPLTTSLTNMREFTGSLKTSGPELIENLNKATKDLRVMIEENRPALRSAAESLDHIAKQVDKGEGTLGKLVKDDSLYTSLNKAAEGVNKTLSAVDRFRTFITLQAQYLTRDSEVKGYFDVTLQPTPDKYYILGLTGGTNKLVKTTETTYSPPGVTVKEEETKDPQLRFTALFGKRFGDAAVRIGMIESTFGAGADYFFNEDKGRITAEVWDLQKNEENASSPHVKVGASYFLFKNLFLSAGGDNLLNSRRRGGYVGVGMRFEDEDFKYLLGTLPRIAVQ
jgi:phospholipid/cholesterol/gamma-HCH transport system substrate-binding protein